MTDQLDPGSSPVHGHEAFRHSVDPFHFPAEGMPPQAAYEILHTTLELDGRPGLNEARTRASSVVSSGSNG